jgi:dTDP-4-amino-4,6-dideoxygalactose transaminase
MTEMQATIGRHQLCKLACWTERRRRNAELLEAGFSAIEGLRITSTPEDVGHAYYKYYVFIEPEKLRADWPVIRIIEAINAERIPCFGGSCAEIYRERAFEERGWGRQQPLPVVRMLGETSLMFLVHPTLDDATMADTVAAVGKVLRVARQ